MTLLTGHSLPPVMFSSIESPQEPTTEPRYIILTVLLSTTVPYY